ncbi:toll/interleukin-1 receptor domain-containing protein [Frankia sp. CNm7]|uniref:Toll/interleukin-1 receptor domain-containing protein n=1 Tax=Frankia nepalensis TaxID=1836974 RepID=A0A937RRE6_9ACTN|nr:toll/interleukin-1 receptor domain-containing protein [Frankia nepalensis]MBL7502086.1 toll/interleukin-1 receptor domain-containing protein [Frankia nepalensis]MBL7512681.1 toll/interleukin-1 receptor domain-containing protein [Frankia nepalensis]MBL7520853.1 toll/interleukin-1 receptor domain-containing protein [Frankia nepalensis]MBL7631328.1 toll/interleukin-1 receptor domain-containing protein [Frankia nepalensis]
MPDGEPLTTEELAALAAVFETHAQAAKVLARAGLPPGWEPRWRPATPLGFWRSVSAFLVSGAVPDGRGRVLRAAAELAPDRFPPPASAPAAPGRPADLSTLHAPSRAQPAHSAARRSGGAQASPSPAPSAVTAEAPGRAGGPTESGGVTPAAPTSGTQIAVSTAATETARWDFFVSYVVRDVDWANWIVWYLEDFGHRVHPDSRQAVAGTFVPAGLHDALRTSMHTIVLLSNSYVSSRDIRGVWQRVWDADRDGQGRRLIPVRIDDVKPEGLLAGIVPIDLTGLDEPHALRVLLTEVAASVRGSRERSPSPPRFPGGPPTFPGNR